MPRKPKWTPPADGPYDLDVAVKFRDGRPVWRQNYGFWTEAQAKAYSERMVKNALESQKPPPPSDGWEPGEAFDPEGGYAFWKNVEYIEFVIQEKPMTARTPKTPTHELVFLE